MQIKININLIFILLLLLNISLGQDQYNNDDDSNYQLDKDNNNNQNNNNYKDKYYNNQNDEIEVIVKVKIPREHKEYDHDYVELDDIQDEKCNRCKYYNSNQDTLVENKNNHHHHHHQHQRDICGCLLGYYGKECRKREFNYQKMFIDWSNQFNKTYSADNFYKGYESFKDSSRFITSYNQKNDTTMVIGLTKFSDMTHQEFQNEYLSVLNVTEIDDSMFTPSPTPTETPTPSLCNIEIEQAIINSWINSENENYIQVQVIIKNKDSSPITQLSFYCQVQQIWEVSTIEINKFGLPSWVSSIPVNGSHSFGYIMKSSVIIDLQQVECSYQSNNQNNNSKLLKSYSRPTSIDWRTWNMVSPVKNQGSCGSCYAFSAASTLESHFARKYNTILDLSEQQLVDCTGKYGNGGCSGGWMHNCYKYIQENGGINRESYYKYEGKFGNCRYNPNDAQARVSKHVMIPRNDENSLADAVATVGPVSVAYDSSTREFMYYISGIYYSDNCDKYRTTHAVSVVGYGSENGIDFWILKNSWSESWGEKGYFRMRRNTGDKCGIATAASYPVLS